MHIGTVLGGPELDGAALDKWIGRIVRERSRLRVSDAGEAFEVNFYVPGSKYRPDFEGMRTGRFSRKRGYLMIQVSVPEAVVLSSDPLPYLLETIRAAVVLASRELKRRHVTLDEEAELALLDGIESKLRAAHS